MSGAPGLVLRMIGPGVAIGFCRKFCVQRIDIIHFNAHGRARRGIAMMLRQMQRDAIPAHLHIQRYIRLADRGLKKLKRQLLQSLVILGIFPGAKNPVQGSKPWKDIIKW